MNAAVFPALAGIALLVAFNAPHTHAATTKPHIVEVKNMAFGPSPKSLHVGDIVKWDNHDPVEHTATATDGSFDITLRPNSSGETKMKKVGTISYFCRFHPGMKGQLKVTPVK